MVVTGSAKVTRGEETFLLSENESTYIPIGVVHALENPGKEPLEIIEIQSGAYLGEDDIVRFSDVYGRASMSQGQWFAVAAKPRQEQIAEVNLKRQGYYAVLPLIEARKRRQNKWTTVTEPLFSGYLFVQLELGKDNLAPIRSTLGCRDLVRIGSGLVPVPEDVMAPLLSLSSSPKTSESCLARVMRSPLRKAPLQDYRASLSLLKAVIVRRCL